MKNINWHWGAVVKTVLLALLCAFLHFPLLGQPDFWHKTSGPLGGPINAMAISPAGTILVSTFGESGIYRSTDLGATWIPTNPYSYATFFGVGSDGVLLAGNGVGIDRSTDDGLTWQTAYMNYIHEGVSFARSPDGDLYAGMNVGGVLRSTDNGASWLSAGLAASFTSVRSLAVTPNGHVFAGVSGSGEYESGVYRSTDNGTSWTRVSPIFRFSAPYALAASARGDIFAGPILDGMYRSTDDGDTWTELWGYGTRVAQAIVIDAAGYVYAGFSHGGIAVGGLACSTDNGDSWQQIGFTDQTIQSLAIDSSGGLLVGSSRGVHRSIDHGGSWTHIGLPITTIRGLAATATGRMLAAVDIPNAASTASGVYSSTNKGVDWDTSGAVFDPLCLKALSGNTLLAGSYVNLWRSTNDGSSWESLPPIGEYAYPYDFLLTLQEGILAGTENGIYLSTDMGMTWIPTALRDHVSSLAVNSAGLILAGTWGQGIKSSWSASGTWIQQGMSGMSVNALMVDSRNRIYVGTRDAGIYRSTDAGASFHHLALGAIAINCFHINSDGEYFAGTDSNGVYASSDSGATWGPLGGGLSKASVLSLATDHDGFLFAGTQYRGVFRSAVTTTSVKEALTSYPKDFALSQNYPNPFNAGTVIGYRVEGSGVRVVRLVVYDVLGREVKTLLDEQKPAGTYQVEFDGSNLSSGVYIYRLSAGDYVESKRMILLR
jgi:hypothetical protein